jgi:hypothetical protein
MAKPRALIALAGALWLALGVFLGWRGWTLFSGASSELSPLAFWGVLVAALIVGAGKGFSVIRKAALRNASRLKAFPSDRRAPLVAVFSGRMWAFIGFMMCLGVALRFIHGYELIRGGILLAVGEALAIGALFYWQAFQKAKAATDA